MDEDRQEHPDVLRLLELKSRQQQNQLLSRLFLLKSAEEGPVFNLQEATNFVEEEWQEFDRLPELDTDIYLDTCKKIRDKNTPEQLGKIIQTFNVEREKEIEKKEKEDSSEDSEPVSEPTPLIDTAVLETFKAICQILEDLVDDEIQKADFESGTSNKKEEERLKNLKNKYQTLYHEANVLEWKCYQDVGGTETFEEFTKDEVDADS